MNNFELMSIRQASKIVFPKIHDSTISHWMTNRVFMPRVYKPPPAGPGDGCKLDLADLVTIGALHSLFKCGLKFEALRLEGFDRDNILFFSDNVEFFEMGYIPAREKLPAAYTSRRRIQEFLYAHEFKVMLYWGRANDPLKDFLAFYPLSDVERHNLLLSRITDDNETLLGHIFINCETWFHYVCSQLGQSGKG